MGAGGGDCEGVVNEDNNWKNMAAVVNSPNAPHNLQIIEEEVKDDRNAAGAGAGAPRQNIHHNNHREEEQKDEQEDNVCRN